MNVKFVVYLGKKRRKKKEKNTKIPLQIMRVIDGYGRYD